MIIELRKQLKGRGFKIVLWITFISMGIVFAPSFFRKSSGSKLVVATVNGNDIGYAAFEYRVHQETERIAMLRQQFGPEADMLLKAFGMDNPKSVAYQSLVQEELLTQVARGLHLVVSPDYIAQKLCDTNFIMQELGDLIPPYLIDEFGCVNMNALKTFLQRNRITVSDFEAAIESKMQHALVKDIVAGATYVSRAELAYKTFAEKQAKDFSVLLFKFEDYLNKARKNKVTDDELLAYFEKNNAQSKRYWEPERRSGTVWHFSPSDFSSAVSDDEVESYYNQQKAQKFIKEPAKVKVRRILFPVSKSADEAAMGEIQAKAQSVYQEAINDPAQFAQLAQKYSGDKKTASNGGLTDYLKKGVMDPEFDRAAFRLKNDGDISPIFTTADGLEIIQRVEKTKPTYKELSEVAKDIKQTLAKQQFKTAFVQQANAAIAQGNQDPAKLERFIQEKNGKSKRLELESKDSSPLVQKLFKLKASAGKTAFLDGDQGVILALDEVKEAFSPAFADVRKTVEDDYYHAQAKKMMASDMEKAKAASATKDFKQIASELGVEYEKTGFVKKNDNKKLSDLEAKGLISDRFMHLSQVGTVAVIESPTKSYLVKLDALESAGADYLEAEKQNAINAAYQEKKALLERGFVASLYRNATIKPNETLVNFKDETH